MIVVADTSPLNYLILIEEADVLRKLYGRVLIPPAVQVELLQTGAPPAVVAWMQRPPDWLEVRSPTTSITVQLDPGEAAAIALAEELHAGQIILDEDIGRQEALRRGLFVIGTVGILRDAHRQGYLDIRTALDRLKATNFHISPSILAKTLSDFT
jgi:predicted nucleic acid-binding protein